MTVLPQSEDSIAVLIATRDRFSLLLERSLTSVRNQRLRPETVVVVNDGSSFSDAERVAIADRIPSLDCHIIENARTPSAAGAWNTGLHELSTNRFRGFVALLDDDDEWDPDHLLLNLSTARRTGANVVVSGLRFLFNGHRIDRPLIQSLSAEDFLVGNPGWQGSNTFVSFDLLKEVGGFRDGLQSLNDRDLAFRLLRSPRARKAFTGQWTATWHSRSEGTLSARRSPAKISGLRWFWNLYGSEMSDIQAAAFFERAKNLFGVERCEIVESQGDVPPHSRSRGDLDGPT